MMAGRRRAERSQFLLVTSLFREAVSPSQCSGNAGSVQLHPHILPWPNGGLLANLMIHAFRSKEKKHWKNSTHTNRLPAHFLDNSFANANQEKDWYEIRNESFGRRTTANRAHDHLLVAFWKGETGGCVEKWRSPAYYVIMYVCFFSFVSQHKVRHTSTTHPLSWFYTARLVCAKSH
jgi:hypothetical protein